MLTFILLLTYLLLLAYAIYRIVLDTENPLKAMSYLLFVLFIPLIGILFYFSIGINYRKRKLHPRKWQSDQHLKSYLLENRLFPTARYLTYQPELHESSKSLMDFIASSGVNPVTAANEIRLLMNGEQKFPEILNAIQNARHHIHLEYYIIEDDQTGKELELALRAKVAEGVAVRLIYDDFGCRSIWKTWLKRMQAAGVIVVPFNRLHSISLTNRLNYRNHRKIIIVDGNIGFVGGMNISDRYINKANSGSIYWRDTHLRIEGEGVATLQYLFLCDWNYYSNASLVPDLHYFPPVNRELHEKNKILQFVTSGPDSTYPTILFSILEIIHHASSEILITTPYLIPGISLFNALILAAQKGVSVKILVPNGHASFFIHYAAQSYYDDFLQAGIEIYLYTKGFVHAKTMVVDSQIAIIGTANMDDRSFELNYEVNALVFDRSTAEALCHSFRQDIEHAKLLNLQQWIHRNKLRRLPERFARLISHLL